MFKKFAFLSLSLAGILFLSPGLQAQFTDPSVNISKSAADSLHPKIFHMTGFTTELALWIEVAGSTDTLMFSKSTDEGQTWSAPFMLSYGGQIRIQNMLTDDYSFSFCVDDPWVHVVMQYRTSDAQDYEIWYRRSIDLGDSWENWRQLTDNSADSCFPDVDARGSYVHVCYQDSWPGNPEIMYKRITYGGGGDVDQTRRLTFSSTNSTYPRIAVSQSGAIVNIVYQDYYSGQNNIFYKYIPDYGAGAFETRQLTFNTTGYNGRPDIAFGWGTYEQYVYIVYETDWPGNQDIMYKRVSNWGGSGGTIYTARLSYSTSETRSCTVDFDNAYGYVHVVYHDNWPGNNTVMHKKFTPGGGGGFVTQRVSYGTGDCSHASVSASGSWAFVVWMDNSSGNYEILLKRGT